MSAKVNINKKRMLGALEKSLGVVTTASKIAGIDRTMHYRWMKDDPQYRQSVNEIEDIAIDFAEAKLHKLIEGGDTSATIFFLKTKAKKRGYIERQEHDHTTKGDKIEQSPIIVANQETADLLKELRSGKL